MVAAGLATNCSNALAHARVTNIYSRCYEPRALLQESRKLEARKERAGHSDLVAGSNLDNAGN